MNFAVPKQTIPSGGYWLGHSEPILLQAFLGTCVGVALFDAKSEAISFIEIKTVYVERLYNNLSLKSKPII